LTGNDATGLLQLIEFNNPFQPGGIPAAIVTAKLVVSFNSAEYGEETREFNVYNYRLIQDTTSPETFYYCLPGFNEALTQTL